MKDHVEIGHLTKYRVHTLFQKQISRTFPGLFQDSD